MSKFFPPGIVTVNDIHSIIYSYLCYYVYLVIMCIYSIELAPQIKNYCKTKLVTFSFGSAYRYGSRTNRG